MITAKADKLKITIEAQQLEVDVRNTEIEGLKNDVVVQMNMYQGMLTQKDMEQKKVAEQSVIIKMLKEDVEILTKEKTSMKN